MARRLTLAFLETQSGAGLALAAAGLAALALANSPAAPDYFGLVRQPVPIQIGGFAETRTLGQWVKDGLMAVFLLLVGMEIKFQLLRGELAGARRLAVPLAAAIGGLIGPALAYWAVAGGSGFAAAVWPAGASTDLAFALAVLALAGPKLPAAARMFLLAVAIVDDLAAVGLVGAMSAGRLDGEALASAALAYVALLALGRWRRAPYLLYVVSFVWVWTALLRSGLNPAVAGIACAFAVPASGRRPGRDSVLADFIASLHPWVAFGVLPLYAFTAAGVPLAGFRGQDWLAPLPLGLLAAMMIGKPAGVFCGAFLAAVAKLGRRPAGLGWGAIAGLALIAGGGFTVSLYVAALALAGEPPAVLSQARVAVIVGSLAALTAGAAVTALAQRRGADPDLRFSAAAQAVGASRTLRNGPLTPPSPPRRSPP